MTKTERVNSLDSSKPALELQLALIEVQRQLAEFNPAPKIQAALDRLETMPTRYGELIAEQIVPIIEPITQILGQLQDVLSDLRTSETLKPAPIPAPKPVAKPAASKPAPAPVPARKDPMIQALPWLLLGNLVISLGTLATVFLQG